MCQPPPFAAVFYRAAFSPKGKYFAELPRNMTVRCLVPLGILSGNTFKKERPPHIPPPAGIFRLPQKPLSGGNFLPQAFRKTQSSSGREMNAQDVFLIDLASFYRVALTEKIERIRRAILGRQRIAFRYFYEKGESARAIEPYRLVFQWSAWYVFGYCMEREDFRLFKLNRLRHTPAP